MSNINLLSNSFGLVIDILSTSTDFKKSLGVAVKPILNPIKYSKTFLLVCPKLLCASSEITKSKLFVLNNLLYLLCLVND